LEAIGTQQAPRSGNLLLCVRVGRNVKHQARHVKLAQDVATEAPHLAHLFWAIEQVLQIDQALFL
jgi:hypothetical protein